MNSYHKKKNKKLYTKKQKNSFKKREIKIKLLSFVFVILAIICAICLISNSQKKEETFSQIDSYNSSADYVENIISVEVPSSSDDIDENTTTENNITTNENNQTNNNNNVTNNTTNTNKITGNSKYYIKVNYTANVVTVYQKDSSGNYTEPVKAMVCSTGSATPRSGVYSIPTRWRWGELFGKVFGQYCVKITGNILFHSVPYLKNDPSTLKYWEYDKLGTSASAGCIRLTVADAQWIYNNCSNGTKVEFYSSSNLGPLGKPTAQKISGNEACRNWDPTDPNPNNPWRNISSDNNTSSDNKDNSNTTNSNVNNADTNTSIENNTTTDNSNNTITNDTIDNTINNTIENSTNENLNTSANNTIDNSINNNSISNNTTTSSNTTNNNNTIENNSISNNTIENNNTNTSQD